MNVYVSVNVCVLQFRFLERKERGRGGGGRGREGESEGVPLITRLQDRELQEMRDEGQSCDCHMPLKLSIILAYALHI